jgi:hypothetical protein
MANLKYYDSGSEEWESLVIGKQGPTGPQGPAGNDGALSPNAIINGAFEINQRNFSSTTSSDVYHFDRWKNIASDGTTTTSAQTFTPGAAPVAGYEAANYCRIVTTGQTLASAASRINQNIEDVRTFAGQTVTLSFFAKAGTGTPKIALEFDQQFGVGGSTRVTTYAGQVTLSTSWTRYSVTVLIPSLSSKTVGSSSFLGTNFWVSAGSDLNARTGSLGIQSNTFDIWGVQLEAGPTANVFRRNANSLQGELAACQRYFYRATNTSENANSLEFVCIGQNYATTASVYMIRLPVEMRSSPTLAVSSTSHFVTSNSTFGNVTLSSLALTTSGTTKRVARLDTSVASGLVAGNITFLTSNNSSGTLDLNAEL